MFQKILVATDLSDASERMACSLGELKALGTKDIVLLHCINIRDVGTLASQLIKAAEPHFRKQQIFLENRGFSVTPKIALGLPQIEINRQAEEHDCSLIVVGSRGGTMAKEILLGGVASEVVHGASKPVLILRVGIHEEKGDAVCIMEKCSPLGHILFPTDFSDNAEHAYSHLKKFAEKGAEKITLLHVQDEVRIGKHLMEKLDEFNRIDSGRLGRMKEELLRCGAKEVNTEIVFGNPKKILVDKVKANGYSLVLLGSQGRGYIGQFFMGSVSLAVARQSIIPVLLVPAAVC
ncbi:nucleotide-binding universal stress UspA family protein [Aminivibrio pyruvatiphilus]|uniref:Nucleotide-binding universal stress UspA family protein n=1 Tax=Aminivibrio pyruvatiphilus TaxID=1005740 RepID=A0A4R8MKD6_9BACT|nr:nucleotide-binding universal stress UspA family protein [Aminivibrio pyruvatiphilus]